MSESVSTLEIPMERPRLRRWFPFVSAVAVGIILFLATKNVFASAILPSLVAGWSSFYTGLWLLQSDQRRTRARTCFAFYLAAACWKSAAAALTTVIVFAFVAELTGKDPTMEQFSATMLTLVAAVVLSTLIGLGATCSAVAYRIRVWVHPRLRARLDGNLSSVARLDSTHDGFNHAIFVVATSLAFPIVALGGGSLVLLLADETPNEVEMIPAIVSFVTLFAGPFAMIPLYAWLSSRIIARNPQECWPADSADGVQHGFATEPAALDAFDFHSTGGGLE